LLQYGLLRGSFVPPQEIRELRELTRYRVKLLGQRNQVHNRIEKLLQQANVKLSSVATDILGVTGRNILAALLGGNEDAKSLADCAKGTLRRKKDQLAQAVIFARASIRSRNQLAFRHSSRKRPLKLIEDACEAIGAQYRGRNVAAIGDLGVFGFYPNKPITAGEGGMVVTRDSHLADTIRALRNQGRMAADDCRNP
jgi:hypothetical protein